MNGRASSSASVQRHSTQGSTCVREERDAPTEPVLLAPVEGDGARFRVATTGPDKQLEHVLRHNHRSA